MKKRSRNRGAGAFLLALASMACGAEIALFEPIDEVGASTGGRSGTGGMTGLGGNAMGFAGAQNPTDIGFPSEADLLGLRIVLFAKVDNPLGVQFRTISFMTESGTSFPTAPLAADDPVISTLEENTPEDDAIQAFDGSSQTWWSGAGDAGSTSAPVTVGLLSSMGIPVPVSLFLDLHQQEFRAPTDFDVQGYDGKNWWVILAVRGVAWPDDEDTNDRERDQKMFSLPPPRDWYR